MKSVLEIKELIKISDFLKSKYSEKNCCSYLLVESRLILLIGSKLTDGGGEQEEEEQLWSEEGGLGVYFLFIGTTGEIGKGCGLRGDRSGVDGVDLSTIRVLGTERSIFSMLGAIRIMDCT